MILTLARPGKDKLPLTAVFLGIVLPICGAIGFPLYLGIPALIQYANMKPSTYVAPGWERTTGVVVANQRHGSRSYYWDPVVRFQTAGGSVVTFTAGADHDGPVAQGTQVPVAYPPGRPADAKYVGEPGSAKTTALVLGIIATLIGLGVATLGLWILLRGRRPRRPSAPAPQ